MGISEHSSGTAVKHLQAYRFGGHLQCFAGNMLFFEEGSDLFCLEFHPPQPCHPQCDIRREYVLSFTSPTFPLNSVTVQLEYNLFS